MNKFNLFAFAAFAALSLIGSGCQSIRAAASTGIDKLDSKYAAWVADGGLAASIQDYLDKLADKQAQADAPAADPAADPTPPADPAPSGRPADAAPFDSFTWSYGGFKGGSAVAAAGDPIISVLSFSATGLSFKYNTDLSVWGLSHTDASALACMFVQKSDGSWVGGKFDWISSSRTTRGFKGHIIPGAQGETYNGWSLSGVPNPCNAAFVIVSKNGRQRSNVVMAEWRR